MNLQMCCRQTFKGRKLTFVYALVYSVNLLLSEYLCCGLTLPYDPCIAMHYFLSENLVPYSTLDHLETTEFTN